jgi:addiction module HigA family antidote
MRMYNPPHPGKVIYDLCIEPLGLSITDAAKGLGVSRKALSELINGHSGVSSEMAIRLSMAFGGNPDSWLMQQMQYDLWISQQKLKHLRIKSFLKRPKRIKTTKNHTISTTSKKVA